MVEMDCLKMKRWPGSPPLGDAHLSKYNWPFSPSLYSDFLVLPGAVTQISHVQTHREEWQKAENVGIGWGRGRKSVVKKRTKHQTAYT